MRRTLDPESVRLDPNVRLSSEIESHTNEKGAPLLGALVLRGGKGHLQETRAIAQPAAVLVRTR